VIVLGPAKALIITPAKASNTSFPGSAWERSALQALPAFEAEPRMQCVPRQSLGTSNPLLSVSAFAGLMIKALVFKTRLATTVVDFMNHSG